MSEDATRVRLVSEREPLLLQAKRLDQANDDFGQSEPVRFAASAFAANGSPVYLYRFSYLQTAMRERLRAGAPHGGEIG